MENSGPSHGFPTKLIPAKLMEQKYHHLICVFVWRTTPIIKRCFFHQIRTIQCEVTFSRNHHVLARLMKCYCSCLLNLSHVSYQTLPSQSNIPAVKFFCMKLYSSYILSSFKKFLLRICLMINILRTFKMAWKG